jgi:hypothetical protein
MQQTHVPDREKRAIVGCPREAQTASPQPESEDPIKKARSWWRALSLPRRAGFSLGALTYFASYEYVHDFGVKHPIAAAVGVALMIVSGGLGRE